MDDLVEMEARLWDYIDGNSDAASTKAIEKLIAEREQWRARYQALLEIHQLMGAAELEHPSIRFTKNVMEEIAKCQIAPATKKYIDNKVVGGIAFFFISVIIGFLIYGIGQISWSAAGDAGSQTGIDFTAVNYRKIFNNNLMNLFMMLNTVLGLKLLDSYLANKKKKLAQKVE